MKRPLIYIAGPMGPNDRHRETRVLNSLKHAAAVFNLGGAPIVPHLYHYLDQVQRQSEDFQEPSYEDWLSMGFDIIRCCDALVRIPGESSGADRGVAFALGAGIPVVERRFVRDWIEAWRPE